MTDTAIVQQRNPSILSEGVLAGLRMSSARQLFTADWKTELVLGGHAFNVTVGGVTSGATDLLVTGGGAGTVIDSNQPEMIVGFYDGT